MWTERIPDLGLACRPQQLQVYVAARPFTNFAGDLMQRLPHDAKARLVDFGVCHYMVIFEDTAGRLQMFDFGPLGGDVHVGTPRLLGSEKNSSKHRKGCVQGKVRHKQLDTLPEACMLVGQTSIPLQHVVQYNRGHNGMYQLNVNDCRHYVNKIVHLTTGLPNACTMLIQHQFHSRRSGQTPTPLDHLVPPVRCLTNAENWDIVQRSAHVVGVATLLSLMHPVFILPLASSVDMKAVQGVVAKSVQQAAVITSMLSQQAIARQRTLWSYVAVVVLRQKRGASHEKSHHNIGVLVSKAVAMRLSQVALHTHKAAERMGVSLTVAVDPFKPLKRSLSARMASISTPHCAQTMRDELIVGSTSRQPAAPGRTLSGDLGKQGRIHVPKITAGRVHTGSSVRYRFQVGRSRGSSMGGNMK